jgi:hypothetical protein
MLHSVDDLLASYMSQSPVAFTAFAIKTGKEVPPDYNHDHDVADHYGDDKCEYSCCSEKGYCATPAQHAACIGCIVLCCVCCCYVTDGFNGLWTYWPF